MKGYFSVLLIAPLGLVFGADIIPNFYLYTWSGGNFIRMNQAMYEITKDDIIEICFMFKAKCEEVWVNNKLMWRQKTGLNEQPQNEHLYPLGFCFRKNNVCMFLIFPDKFHISSIFGYWQAAVYIPHAQFFDKNGLIPQNLYKVSLSERFHIMFAFDEGVLVSEVLMNGMPVWANFEKRILVSYKRFKVYIDDGVKTLVYTKINGQWHFDEEQRGRRRIAYDNNHLNLNN